MFGPTPPRRTSSASTRNESETVCSWSATSWSANRPGKVIRWSVAIEPVTAMRTAGLLGGVDGLSAPRYRRPRVLASRARRPYAREQENVSGVTKTAAADSGAGDDAQGQARAPRPRLPAGGRRPGDADRTGPRRPLAGGALAAAPGGRGPGRPAAPAAAGGGPRRRPHQRDVRLRRLSPAYLEPSERVPRPIDDPARNDPAETGGRRNTVTDNTTGTER